MAKKSFENPMFKHCNITTINFGKVDMVGPRRLKDIHFDGGDDDDRFPKKKQFKKKVKTPSTSSEELPPKPRKGGKSCSTSLDMDENMNLYQKKHDDRLKEQRGKAASTNSGDFTNAGKVLDNFPLCSCSPPTTAVMNFVKKDGPNKGRSFYQCRH